MVHIPPSRASTAPGTNTLSIVTTNAEVIREYTAKMTTKFNSARMTGARGYLLISDTMGEAERQLMRQWFQGVNITPQEKIYNKDRDIVSGSGNLVISRETAAWPPSIGLA